MCRSYARGRAPDGLDSETRRRSPRRSGYPASGYSPARFLEHGNSDLAPVESSTPETISLLRFYQFYSFGEVLLSTMCSHRAAAVVAE